VIKKGEIRMFRPREEDEIAVWICPDQGLCINISREGEGYYFKSIDIELISKMFEYVPEGY
jgi:hypothetical protein